MKPEIFYSLIVLMLLVILCFFYASRKTEGFDLYDKQNIERMNYVAQGQQRYNPLSETAAGTKNFLGTIDPTAIKNANTTIQSALQTSDLGPSEMVNSLLDITPAFSRAAIPQQNQAYGVASVCESLRSRQSCNKLDDPIYANCGVCIKGGTPITYSNPEKHIGGLLVTTEDVAKAKADVAGTTLPPTYQPTLGSCPPGFFFKTSAECTKQANRLDCKEAGATGGFNGGVTIEGSPAARDKCAQVINNGDPNVFIYEPKGRTFNVNLRVLAPLGTGTCKVYVYDQNKNQLGYEKNSTPGREFTVLVSNVRENMPVAVIVALEAPYRYGSNNELYQVQLAQTVRSASEAESVCQRYGSQQATLADLYDAQTNGAQLCNQGWTADGLAWPSQTTSATCGLNGVNRSTGSDGDSWCKGLKPPQSTNMIDNVLIPNWYQSQTNSPSIVSMFDVKTSTPYMRGVLLQWEMATGNSVRTVSFENSITSVNGTAPSSTKSGKKMFPNLENFGTYAIPSVIRNPVYKQNTGKMQGSNAWIWSNQPLSQQVQFNAVVPGIFLDSFYAEDADVSTYGALVTTPSISKILANDPCSTSENSTGTYNLGCLQSAFVSAGGDVLKGQLVTQKGGLAELNKIGTLDQINDYLANLYAIATTGKDIHKNPVGSSPATTQAIVNDASQKMFGFSIATPCEIIARNINGDIVIAPKKGAQIDSFCLDYLWTNTGSEQERGEGDSASFIKHTYTNIGQRYSGLRSSEGSILSRTSHQFMMCQRTGSMAPIDKSGQVNKKALDKAMELGTLESIQKYYDSIFQTANDPRGGPNQEDAIQQCYGLNRAKW
jgi:hypothetical protein